MATIAYSDYLQTLNAGVLVPKTGVYVQLVSNNTGTAYVSDAATDSTGKFNYATKPPGDTYTVNTGPSSGGAWTAFGDSNYAVPVVQGETPAFQSTTELGSGPYAATALAGGADYSAALRVTGGYPWYDVTHPTFGATGNGQIVTDGAMNGTTGVLTSASNKFVGGDVGKRIFVVGAAAAGATLSTTIASYQNAGQVTLTGVSATLVTNASVTWGTDDRTAIQAAITAAGVLGGTVYVPRGVFVISTTILLSSNVTFTGAGAKVTTVTGAFDGSTGLIGTTKVGTTQTVYSNIEVSNMTLRSGLGHLMVIQNSDGVSVLNIEGFFVSQVVLREGLWTQHCQHVIYQGCYTHDYPGDGLQLNHVTNFIVTNNLVDGGTNGDDGIDIDCDFLDTSALQSNYGTVTGNTIRNHHVGSAIRVEDSSYISVVGNTIDGVSSSPTAGIYVNSANAAAGVTQHIQVVGNNISNCTDNGIKVSQEGGAGTCKHVSVTGNNLDNCGQVGGADIRAGIQVASAQNVHISDNYLSGCGGNDANGGAIVIYKGDLVRIHDNTIFGGTFGIRPWNGDVLQTYTSLNLTMNRFISVATSNYVDAFTQAGVTIFDEMSALSKVGAIATGAITASGNVQSANFTDLANSGNYWSMTASGGTTTLNARGGGITQIGPSTAFSKDLRRSRQTPTETVLVSGVDATTGELIGVTLTAARVVGAPLNPAIGQRLVITLIQSGAGAFAVTWNAIFKGITGGTSGATPTRATFIFAYDGTNWNLEGGQPTWV